MAYNIGMKVINLLIIRHILKKYDEMIERGIFSDYVFRIHHILFQNSAYRFLIKHESELTIFLQKRFHLSSFTFINLVFYPSKFLVIRIKKEEKQ